MDETTYGDPWDVAFDSETGEDIICLDTGDNAVHLGKSDLQAMLEALDA